MMLLVLMAALPMVFVGWIATAEYREVERVRDLADEAQHTAMGIGMYDSLRLALVNESSWFAVELSVERLGLTTDAASELLGFNIAGENARARAYTDMVMAREPATEYRDRVEGVRLAGESATFDRFQPVTDAYHKLVDELGEVSADERVALEDRAGDVPTGADVVEKSRIAAAANEARYEHMQQVWSYLESEFRAPENAVTSYLELVAHRDRTSEALDWIDRKSDVASPVALALDEVRASDDLLAFDAALDEMLNELFDPNRTADAGAVDPVAQMAAVAEVFGAGMRAAEEFESLTTASDVELAIVGAGVIGAAESEWSSTVRLVLLLGACSLVAAVALARYIGRPIVRLAGSAQRLGTGEDLELRSQGPKEVRQVSSALLDASKNLVRMESLEHEATHDELTGVPTRRLVREHLSQALARSRRSGAFGAVMFVDVDHFKEINDTYGHAAGDQVLRVVAERIREPLRETDLVGRYGGDEFIVVAESVGSAVEAERLAERIVSVVAVPVDLADVSSHPGAAVAVVTVSIGVSVFAADDESIDDALERADDATYDAKATGRNRAILANGRAARDRAASRS